MNQSELMDELIRLSAENEVLKEHQKVLTAAVSMLADHRDKIQGSRELFANAKSAVGMKSMIDRGEPK